MIKVSFMSGIILEFDDLFDGAKIYNLKRSICDWLDENDEETDISLVHLYDMEHNELENNKELTDNFYKAFVNRYDIRIIYVKNGNVYYHRKNEPESDDDPQIYKKDLSNLQETNTIKYYFDRLSFESSWYQDPCFFTELGYSLRDDYEYNNIYSSEEDEYEEDEDQNQDKIKYHTDRCLRLIFPKIKLRYIS